MRNNVLAIFLLLLLLIPSGVTFLFMQYQKKQIKRDVKEKILAGIDKKELVFLKFSEAERQSDLVWFESEEFKYKDEFYDIVSSQVVGDTTYYWCWWDSEDTKLNRLRMELVSMALGNSPRSHENKARLFDFLESLYCTEAEVHRPGLLSASDMSRFLFRKNLYESLYHSPPIPPPKAV